MSRSRTIVGKLSLVTLVAASAMGCNAKPRVAQYDLSPAVAAAGSRASMAAVIPVACATVRVVGPAAAKTEFGEAPAYLFNAGGDVGDSLGAMVGVGGSYRRIVTAPKPLGEYVQRAIETSLASRGIGSAPGAASVLEVSLDRFQFDARSDRVRTMFIECGLSVRPADGRPPYTRRVMIESAAKRADQSTAVSIAGGLMAGFVGIGFSGDGVRKKEEQQATAAAIRDALFKLQDEIAADPDLLAALAPVRSPGVASAAQPR